jgi:MFS family permease
MATSLLRRNRNFRLLFGAGALTNLGDGLVVLALPWLATLMTNDPIVIAGVAAATTLPWLFFAIPAGVIVDRSDLRRLIAQADLLRAAIVTAILMLALNAQVTGAAWMLAGLAFLLGSAEVLRDNAAQTILPAIVQPADLEAANGQLWGAEQLAGQFIGPPLAGVLIGMGVGMPFGLDIAMLVLAAGLVWMITLPSKVGVVPGFATALRQGIAFMRGDALLLRLAIVLSVANFIAAAVLAVQVMFAREVLGLTPAGYGLVLSVGAAGAITGSLLAPQLTRIMGSQSCLYLSVAVWCVGYGLMGICTDGYLMAFALFAIMTASMVWNVITVSWRQRRIPAQLLGRVNSIYRFFGWGSMPLGALSAGVLVAILERDMARELAIRATFITASISCAILLIYTLLRLRLD